MDPNYRGPGEHLTNSNKTWIKACISTMVDKKFPLSTEVARQAKRAHVFKQWLQFQGQMGPYKRFKSGGRGGEHEMWAAISQFTAADWWRRWGPEEHKELFVALALHVLNQITNGSATERVKVVLEIVHLREVAVPHHPLHVVYGPLPREIVVDQKLPDRMVQRALAKAGLHGPRCGRYA